MQRACVPTVTHSCRLARKCVTTGFERVYLSTDDNQWIIEGAHLMILAPAALIDVYPTDPQSGGPYVMWNGTPYEHLMVPIGERDQQ